MKLLKRVTCFMLVLTMVICNNAVITFAESCSVNGAEAGQNEENNVIVEPAEELSIDEETEAEESVSVYDSRESKNSVSEREGDFTYRKIQNGISILKYRGSDTDVVIPKEIDGYPVVDILYYAFQNNKTIKTIVMPDTVERIGSYAFENCTNLTDVTLSNKLMSIDNYAFQNCEKLQTINFPEGLLYIYNYVFLNCKQLQTVNLPEGLNYIGEGAFANCKKLQTIDLPEGLIFVGGDAFSGTALTEITFPRNIIQGKYVLRNSNVEKVTFADGTTKIPDHICSCARELKNG